MLRIGQHKTGSILCLFAKSFQQAQVPFIASLLRMCDDLALRYRLGSSQVVSSLSSVPDSSSYLLMSLHSCLEELEAGLSKFEGWDLYLASLPELITSFIGQVCLRE